MCVLLTLFYSSMFVLDLNIGLMFPRVPLRPAGRGLTAFPGRVDSRRMGALTWNFSVSSSRSCGEESAQSDASYYC